MLSVERARTRGSGDAGLQTHPDTQFEGLPFGSVALLIYRLSEHLAFTGLTLRSFSRQMALGRFCQLFVAHSHHLFCRTIMQSDLSAACTQLCGQVL